MQHLFVFLLLVCAGSVFGASSSSSAAASSSSTVSNPEEAVPALMPMHKVSLYELCQYAIIKAHKVREAEDVEQREELGVLVPLWKRDIKKTVTSLNALLKYGIRTTSFHNKIAREKWTRYAKLLVKKGANPDIRFPLDGGRCGEASTQEVSLLIWCTGHIKNYELANLVLDAGADVDLVSFNGGAALHYLCDQGVYWGNFPLLQRLLTAGADPNKLDKNNRTPLHDYVRDLVRDIKDDVDPDQILIPIIVREFLDAGFDPSIKDVDGKTVADLLHDAKQAIADTMKFRKFGRREHHERALAEMLDQAIALLPEQGIGCSVQ